MTLNANDPRLTAYALGELDDAECVEIETALRSSPQLAAEVASIRAAATSLESAFRAEPALELTAGQRDNIDQSRRREPAGSQGVERKRHDNQSRDRKGAGPGSRHSGTEALRQKGSRGSERGAEATQPRRPNFLRRHWIPTALAASVTIAVGAWYVTLPELSRARSGPMRSNRAPAFESPDLSIRRHAPSVGSEGDLGLPEGGSGYSMSPSSRHPNTPETNAFNGSLAFNAPTGAPTQIDPATMQGLASLGYVGGGRLGVSSDAGGDGSAPPSSARPIIRTGFNYSSYDPTVEMSIAAYSAASEQFTGVLSTGFELPAGCVGFGAACRTRAIAAQTSGAYVGGLVDCWDPKDQELSRCIQFQLEGPPTGDAYAPIFENPFLLVLREPLSTFSIDVDTASYSNVRRFLSGGRMPPRDAVRIEELINYFDYDYPQPTGGEPFSMSVETSDCPWDETHRLARIGIKGMEFAANQRPAANLVFLLDVSGSMSPPDRLPMLRESLKELVGELRRDDSVAIVTYAGSSGLALPATRCSNKSAILTALENLQSGGSTDGGEGIQLAYNTASENFIEGGVNRVILATDGDFNVGITQRESLHALIEEKAKSGVFLTVLGVGMGNLKDATLETLADKGNGNYAYLDTPLEARKVLVDQLGGTLVTIAKDVKIQVEFNPAQVSAYRLIGYENRMLAAQDFNDDKKDAGEIGAGHTVTAFYEIVPAGVAVDAASVDPLKYQYTARDEERSDEATPTTSGQAPRRSDEVSERGAEATRSEEGDDATDENRSRGLKPAAQNGELMTVKLRYKAPDEDVSKLIEVPVIDDGGTFADSSDDVAFALSVASFGMLLRGSPHSENFNYDFVHELAAGSVGPDQSGYRAEFLTLVDRARTIDAAAPKPDNGR